MQVVLFKEPHDLPFNSFTAYPPPSVLLSPPRAVLSSLPSRFNSALTTGLPPRADTPAPPSSVHSSSSSPSLSPPPQTQFNMALIAQQDEMLETCERRRNLFFDSSSNCRTEKKNLTAVDRLLFPSGNIPDLAILPVRFLFNLLTLPYNSSGSRGAHRTGQAHAQRDREVASVRCRRCGLCFIGAGCATREGGEGPP